jgi:hypothetical protein
MSEVTQWNAESAAPYQLTTVLYDVKQGCHVPGMDETHQ